MRPPDQSSAVINESRLFPTTMDSECTVRADLFTEVKNMYKSNTMLLLLILFYYLISKNLSFITKFKGKSSLLL